MLLLAAATETGLLAQLEQALPLPVPSESLCLPLASSAAVRRRLLLTLLFLGSVGLQRTWDLRGYTSDGLALLTGRPRAYGYRYTEAFLSQVTRADGAERLTDALASWTTHLWHPPAEGSEPPQTLTCYVDGHRKPVYSDVLLPRGLVGRLGVILGCRALLLLHDEHGHPLFVTTYRGDHHLTAGVPAFLTRYEQRAGNSQITRMIVDREGMATEFLAQIHAEGRSVVTILQTTQYRDLSSFTDVGTFVPLSRDAHGQVIREVAPARMTLPREDHPDEPLCVQVALIRDLRRKEQERSVYELDNRKDQVMSACKVALANLAMWVRDRYFPASYAQATWKRLLPFFQLPGTITHSAQMVQIELRPFNDRALNRDLAILCERVNHASPHLPDERRLSFTISSACCILAAQKKAKIP